MIDKRIEFLEREISRANDRETAFAACIDRILEEIRVGGFGRTVVLSICRSIARLVKDLEALDASPPDVKPGSDENPSGN